MKNIASLVVFFFLPTCSAVALVTCLQEPPYPPLLAPSDISESMSILSSSRFFHVERAGDLQGIINAATSGSRILIDLPLEGLAATISGKTLVIEKAAGSDGACIGINGRQPSNIDPQHGASPFRLTNGAIVIFRNIVLKGGAGGSDQHFGQDSGIQGGNGAPAVRIESSTAVFINCQVSGGAGGHSGGSGAELTRGGGHGGSGVYMNNASAYADMECSFAGSQGGTGGSVHSLYCTHTSTSGRPVDGGTVTWQHLQLQMQIIALNRAIGDFDESGFVDTVDFLFLLDYWHTTDISPSLGLEDFFSLLDHWMSELSLQN